MRIGLLTSLLVLSISFATHADEMRFPLTKHITYAKVLDMDDHQEFIGVRSERFIRAMKAKRCLDIESDRLFNKRVAKRFGKNAKEIKLEEPVFSCSDSDDLPIPKYSVSTNDEAASRLNLPYYACLATLEDDLVESSTHSEMGWYAVQCQLFGLKTALLTTMTDVFF